MKAGGTLANLALGSMALAAQRAATSPIGRYFSWLLAAVNLLMGAGYLAVDPAFGFGDWTAFLDGLPHAGATRWLLAAGGALLYGACVMLLLRGLRRLVGHGQRARAHARKLCIVPYVGSGGVLLTVAALLNSEGPVYALTSGLATLGGTSALAWISECLPAGDGEHEGIAIGRSRAWLIVGALTAAACVGVLGPGIRF